MSVETFLRLFPRDTVPSVATGVVRSSNPQWLIAQPEFHSEAKDESDSLTQLDNVTKCMDCSLTLSPLTMGWNGYTIFTPKGCDMKGLAGLCLVISTLGIAAFSASQDITTVSINEVGYIKDAQTQNGSAEVLKRPKGLYVAGDYAYVTSRDDSGLSIIDISNASNPTEVGYIQDDGKPGGQAHALSGAYGIYVSGNYAYVTAVWEASLTVINVSEPTSPTEVGYIQDDVYPNGTATALNEPVNVFVSGDYAYVTCHGAGDGLSIIDISDPANPTEAGYIQDNSHNGTATALHYPYGVWVSGDFAYVTTSADDSLSVINISNASNPVEVGYILDDESPETGAKTAECLDLPIGLFVSGNYAYVGSRFDSALTIIDISNPTSPVEVGYIQDDDPIDDNDDTDYPDGEANALWYANGVFVSGDYAYVASYEDAVTVINVSDPINPSEVNYIFDDSQGGAATALGDANRIFVANGHVYATAYGEDGLSILDTSIITYRPGDVNQDGTINSLDVTQCELCILYPATYPPSSYPGWDANQDGQGPNSGDILTIEYMILGIWPPSHIHIEAPNEKPYCTDFTASICITDVKNFDSASYDVTYNSSVLEVKNVTAGKIVFTKIPVANYSFPEGAGMVRIENDVPGSEGVSGSGWLSKVHFHVKGSPCDTSPIAFNESNSWLKDNTGAVINVTWEDDSLHVAPTGQGYTVTDTSSYRSVRTPAQRSNFYANGRHWVFYETDNDIYCRSSPTGQSWSSPTLVEVEDCPFKYGAMFDVWEANGYAHFVFAPLKGTLPAGNVSYIRGELNSNGAINWDPRQIVYACPRKHRLGDPVVTVSDDGYPYIAASIYRDDGSTSNVTVFKSSTSNGTWIEAWSVNVSGGAGTFLPSLTPLENDEVLCTYYSAFLEGAPIKSRLWNGSGWEAEEVCTDEGIPKYSFSSYSVVAINSTAHLVYLGNVFYNLSYVSRNPTTGWGSEELIYHNSSSYRTVPALSRYGNDVYCFWLDDTGGGWVFYRVLSNGSWGDEVKWIHESTPFSGNWTIQSSYYLTGDPGGVVYQVNTSSPYQIRFGRDE